MAQFNPLKALIQRLTSTPVEELPTIAYFLASSISECLICPQNPGNDRTALLHKLKARISSLLQDRTAEGRFTAVVVAKAVVEAGGREVLVDVEPWIRGLIGILNKSDPAATKRLAILTVSRAFTLTQDYPSIVREITTPLLPSFNTACLAAIRPKTTNSDKGTRNVLSPLLSTVLQCWIELLPQHPATFRPFVTRFRPICLSLLSDAATPESICRSAEALLVTLHHSAPKNNVTSEWSQLCQDVFRAAHAAAASLFRSLHEDWVPAGADIVQDPEPLRLNGVLPGWGPDALGLAGWRGMREGSQRLSRLLGILEQSLSVVSAAEVLIPLGGIMELCARLLTLTIPGSSKDSPYTLRTNPEFGRDERETLWTEIPIIHGDCLRLLSVVVEKLQHAILPISKSIIDLLTWVFDAEHELSNIRASSYELLRFLLPMMSATTNMDVKKFSPIVSHACKDLLPNLNAVETHRADGKGTKTAADNVESFTGPSKAGGEQIFLSDRAAIQAEATDTISLFLQYVPARLIPNSLRIEIDRTVVLSQERQALLASVLNPATAQQGEHVPASLLPFLAHTESGLAAEALLRPRMAVVLDRPGDSAEQEDLHTTRDETAENNGPEIDSSFLDQRGQALETISQNIAEQKAMFDKHEATSDRLETFTATKPSAEVEADVIRQPAAKRDFAAMDGDEYNGWRTAEASMSQSADTDAKKARVNGRALHTSSWGNAGLAEKHITTKKINGSDGEAADTVLFPARAIRDHLQFWNAARGGS